MPASSEYTPWRRTVMQAVMWMIFAATLGLAAVISHRGSRSAVALGAGQRLGILMISLPQGWTVDKHRGSLTASERSRDGQSRTVTISQERLDRDPLPSADEYLQDHVGGELEFDGIKFAGLGVVGVYAEGDIEGNDGASRHVLVGAAVLPSHVAVMIELKGSRFFDRSDLGLFRKIADGIKAAGTHDLPPSGDTVATAIER